MEVMSYETGFRKKTFLFRHLIISTFWKLVDNFITTLQKRTFFLSWWYQTYWEKITVYGRRMSVCECKHHRHLPLWKIVQHPHWLWTNKPKISIPLSVSFDSVKAGLWKCRREVICGGKTNVKHGLSESDECFAWQINCVNMMDSLHHHSHQVYF